VLFAALVMAVIFMFLLELAVGSVAMPLSNVVQIMLGERIAERNKAVDSAMLFRVSLCDPLGVLGVSVVSSLSRFRVLPSGRGSSVLATKLLDALPRILYNMYWYVFQDARGE
jgi:hypothetical protein